MITTTIYTTITLSLMMLIALTSQSLMQVDAFTLTMMGSRRGKGGMRITDGSTSKNKNKMGKTNKSNNPANSLNQGKGQEITGVSLPAEGMVKGWEFGQGQKFACSNVDGNFYAVQGLCPRCGFDLWKGDLITDEAFEDLPRIACPTCATTFSMKNGFSGPALKRKGLAGFVSGLAKSATMTDAFENAKAFAITRDDETGQVFMRER